MAKTEPTGRVWTDPLPWHINMNNPKYRASLARYHAKAETFGKHFSGVLHALLEPIPGCWTIGLDGYDRHAGLPRCGWTEDPDGAYWVASGVQHEPSVPGDVGRSFTWLQYMNEDGRDDRPVELWAEGSMPFDAEVLAHGIATALRLHRLILASS